MTFNHGKLSNSIILQCLVIKLTIKSIQVFIKFTTSILPVMHLIEKKIGRKVMKLYVWLIEMLEM